MYLLQQNFSSHAVIAPFIMLSEHLNGFLLRLHKPNYASIWHRSLKVAVCPVISSVVHKTSLQEFPDEVSEFDKPDSPLEGRVHLLKGSMTASIRPETE